MATRVYRLYFTGVTTTSDNKASLRIAKNGKVNAVCIAGQILQGAAVDGIQKLEISKQSASSFTLNDSPNSVLCHASLGGAAVASQAVKDNILVAGLAWDVQNGDTLYAHLLLAGTAPASGSISCDIFVQE